MDAALEICRAGAAAEGIRAFRGRALAILGEVVAFDGALFHELSPRVPLERGALIGLDPVVVAKSRRSWDQLAVTLGRFRDVALEREGVATDRDAFPLGSRRRKAWDEIARTIFAARWAMFTHLTVRERIISVVIMTRTKSRAFSGLDADRMRALAPFLATADGLLQSLETGPPAGVATRLACVDGRLTEKQREIVTHVALGHTNRAIAAALGRSTHTVRNQLAEVFRRLGAANRAEVVRLAVLR